MLSRPSRQRRLPICSALFASRSPLTRVRDPHARRRLLAPNKELLQTPHTLKEGCAVARFARQRSIYLVRRSRTPVR